MARGGYRPGAGRPKGKKGKQQAISEEVNRILSDKGMPPELPEKPILPLSYMLRVLNDPETDMERKDKMAQFAAPYFHAKAEAKGTKKESAMELAKKASAGKFGARPAPAKIVPIK